MRPEELNFFDARLGFGNPFMGKGNDADFICSMMKDARIGKAVAVMEEQLYFDLSSGMAKLRETLSEHSGLMGLLPLVPSITGEIKPPEKYLKEEFGENMAGFLLCPDPFRIPRRPAFLAEWFRIAQARGIPVWYRMEDSGGYEYIADVLLAYPELKVVLSTSDVWPVARKIYPLFSEYKNTFMCMADLIWLGEIERFTSIFGSDRLLFASDFPRKYAGTVQFMLLNADISSDDKQKIAGENLRQLIGGMKRDR